MFTDSYKIDVLDEFYKVYGKVSLLMGLWIVKTIKWIKTNRFVCKTVYWRMKLLADYTDLFNRFVVNLTFQS